MKRRLLSLLLCISFVLALVPAAALAADADPAPACGSVLFSER